MRFSSSAGRPAGSGRVSVPVRLDLRREALHDMLREQREKRARQVRWRQRQQRVRERPRHARMQQLAEAAAGRSEQLRAPMRVSPNLPQPLRATALARRLRAGADAGCPRPPAPCGRRDIALRLIPPCTCNSVHDVIVRFQSRWQAAGSFSCNIWR